MPLKYYEPSSAVPSGHARRSRPLGPTVSGPTEQFLAIERQPSQPTEQPTVTQTEVPMVWRTFQIGYGFFSQYIEAKQQVPEGSKIVAIKETDEKLEVTYVPKEDVAAYEAYVKQQKEEAKPQTIQAWLGEGISGLKQRFGEAFTPQLPTMIQPSEPMTFKLLRQVYSTQEWLKEMPVEPIPVFEPVGGGLEPPKLVWKTGGEMLAEAVEPAKLPIGFVTEIESFAYPTPSLSGAAFQALISPLKGGLSGKSLQEYYEIMGPYGTLGGFLGLYFTGKAFTAVYGEAKKTVSGAWKGSRPESWLIRHSTWYRARIERGLKPQVVSVPVYGKDVPIGLEKLRAQEMAWMLELTPKTSGITATATAKTTVKPVLPHLISRGGAVSIGYLREYGFTRTRPNGGLLSAPKEIGIEVTEHQLKKLPYLPPIIDVPVQTFSPFVAGLTGSILLKGVVSPTFTRQEKVKTKIEPEVTAITVTKPKRVTKIEPKEMLAPIEYSFTEEHEKQVVMPKVTTITVQLQKTKQITKQILDVPSPPIARLTRSPLDFPRPRRDPTKIKRRRPKTRVHDPLKVTMELWEYPIMPPEKALKGILM